MKQKQETVKAWFGSGSPWVWMNAGAVSIAVIMTIGLLAVIAVRGLGHFWPANVIEATYQIPGEAAKTVIGEVVQAEEVPRARLRSAGMPVPEAGPEFMTRELLSWATASFTAAISPGSSASGCRTSSVPKR